MDRKRKTWRFRLDDATTLEVSAPDGLTEKQVRRRGRWSLILGTLIAALVLAAVALADNIATDGDTLVASSNPSVTDCSVSHTFSGSATISYAGSASSHFASGAVLTVTVTAEAGITASGPATTTLPNPWGPGDTHTFTGISTNVPAGVSSGTYKVTVAVSGAKAVGGTQSISDFFNVNVTCAAAPADTTAPDIQYTLNPASPDGANGWYKSNVTLTWTVTENESPSSLVKTGCVDQNITADQQATTYSCSATSDGGSAGPVSVTIKRDATNPNVSVTGFTDGQVFVKGVDTLPTAGCSRSDATSGIDASGSTGPTVTAGGLTVNGVGSVTYTCYAKDNAGNLANASATYQVNYGGLSGILQPINSDNSSVFSRGKAVPVKFQLAGDEYTGFNFSGWTLKQQQTGCTIDGDPVGGELEPVVENPSNSFRYDAAADQYIYNANFKSKDVGTCWKVVVTLDSGQKLNSAVFKLQK